MNQKRYFDHNQKPVELGLQLATGGEGAVFDVNGKPDVVAKLYHKQPAVEQFEKLSAMVKQASPQLLKLLAWPVATLHGPSGRAFAGFLMPRVQGHKEIHTLYGPSHRRQTQIFQDADWRFLIHAAMNCASAFEEVHRLGHVVGDVNQGNVLVSHKATVYLIDCDSFQIRVGKRTFLCQVGVPQFTPPELQKRGFRGIERTPNHDAFGLALLIFHLLFMGRHPFAGRFLGKGEMPLEKAIEESRFAFSRSANAMQMASPPLSLNLDVLTPPLVSLFERAFAASSLQTGSRPSAKEWGGALKEFLKPKFRQCSNDAGHVYPPHPNACPWCELIRAGAPNFFISVALFKTTSGPSSFNLALVWAEIESVAPPPRSYARPTVPSKKTMRPAPGPLEVDLHLPQKMVLRRSDAHRVVAILGVCCLCLSPMVCFGIHILAAPILVVLFLWGGFELARFSRNDGARKEWSEAWRRREDERIRRQEACERSDDALVALEQQWQTLAESCVKTFAGRIRQLSEQRERLVGIRVEQEKALRELESDVQRRQREVFLDQHYLCDAEIDGIGPGRKTKLLSWNIETALDVTKERLYEVDGFGPVLTSKVLAWKGRIEASFRFNPNQGVPASDVANVKSKYRQIQQHIEDGLRRGPPELRLITKQAKTALDSLLPAIQHALIERRQAELDLSIFA